GDPESSTGEAADPEELLEIQEASLSYYSPNDYAILFVGLIDNDDQDITFSSEVSSLYNVMVNTHHLNPNNIIILYGNGRSSTGGLPANRPVQKATFENLKAAFAKMDRVMNSDSRLFVYIGDHGSGYATNAHSGFTTEEKICAYADNYWGYTKFDAYDFRNALYQIRSGYVTLAFSACFSGGMLDEIINPATGAVKNYTGQAHFAGGAVANHYQYGWFRSGEPCVYEELVSETKFLGIFTIDEDYETIRTWTGALAEGLRNNSSINSAFGYAEQYYYKSVKYNDWSASYPNDGGDYPIDGIRYENGVRYTVPEGVKSHPWHAGENFAIFNSAVPKFFSPPSPYVTSVSDSSITVKWDFAWYDYYVVQWREREGGRWSQRKVTAQEYARNGYSFTINNLAGGKTYDVCVRAEDRILSLKLSSFNSQNIQGTTNKKLTKPQYKTTVSANSVAITITNRDYNESGYTVKYRDLTTNVEKVVTLGNGVTRYTINGLTDGTRYSISIKANGGKYSINTSGYSYRNLDSDWSEKTLYTAKKLIAPNLRMGDDSTDVMSTVTPKGDVSWRGGAIDQSLITGYEYRYREVGSSTWVTYGAPTTTYVSPNLPSGRYEFQFRALGNNLKDGSRNATVDSAWSSIYVTEVAKRFVVTTLADDPNHRGSLRYAINHLADKDMIILAPERIDEYSSTNNTIRLDSTMTITRSVTIDASRCMNADGTPGLIIDANGKQAFNFGENATNVSINGLTIKNASTTSDGGAIFSNAQNLTVMNCVFEDNHANNGGVIWVNKGVNVTIKNSVFSGNVTTHSGAVHIYNVKNGAITISDSKFIGNTSNRATYTDNGSAIHGGGAVFIENTNQLAPVTISGCEFIGNESINARGGAIAFGAGSIATITDSVFDGNTSLWSGGAIEAWSSNVTIDGSLFTGNSATDAGQGYGGAYSAKQSTTKIIKSEFADNYANQQGGALYIAGGSSAMDDVSFHGNSARVGGGAIKMEWSRNTLVNSLLYGNRSLNGLGDAFSLSSTGATSDTETSLSVNNTTIVDNSASQGSTVFIFTQTSKKAAKLNVVNSIVLPKSDGGARALGFEGAFATVTATNVLSTDPSEWNTTTNFWTYDPSKPLFTDAANGDYTLAPNSQAFNRGTDLYTTSDAATVDAMRDLAGAPRQVGGRVDLGAYELQTYETRTWTVTSALDALEEGTLRYALMNAHERDVVLFDESLKGKTISLTNGELPIAEGITIDALNLSAAEENRPGLTISGLGTSRVFNVWKDAGD
ncbi:MAG: fibronectin type III domain-containing protein, partial [Thermoguttaceae bacterium]|nr:fibronectin type III domain-containing protein [Thermoguttaceae bacterium]